MKIANINRILYFTLIVFLLSPDNYLLAKSSLDTQINKVEEKPFLNSLLFTQEINSTNFTKVSIEENKELAIFAAKNNDIQNAALYAENYIKYSGHTEFIDSGYFDHFFDDEIFIDLRNTYSIDFNLINLFYLFSAIVGFFITTILIVKKNQDLASKLLVSGFVLINSLFIFHIFLFFTKLQFRVPHILYMSALSVYLYGPLVYFYFKRVTLNYKFKKIDLLHLLPTLFIFIFMFPIFIMSGSEKLKIMLDVGVINKEPYLNYIVITKFISLVVYGYLILKVYLSSKTKMANYSLSVQKWFKMLVIFTEVYVISYVVYGLTLIGVIPKIDFLFSFQIILMASMVLYIGYSSFLSPSLLSNKSSEQKIKYKKSGLTIKFSEELKDKLIYLLEEEKIYRMNNVNLNYLSERLGTSRHNTSQIINEHFNLNFFELINKYRINEASEILKMDTNNNLNIIDVAYEVGFNNKVTFNKSFKKFLDTTPSRYILTLRS